MRIRESNARVVLLLKFIVLGDCDLSVLRISMYVFILFECVRERSSVKLCMCEREVCEL